MINVNGMTEKHAKFSLSVAKLLEEQVLPNKAYHSFSYLKELLCEQVIQKSLSIAETPKDRQMLANYVSSFLLQVAESSIKVDTELVKNTLKKAYSDIKGFLSVNEKILPKETVEGITGYLTQIYSQAKIEEIPNFEDFVESAEISARKNTKVYKGARTELLTLTADFCDAYEDYYKAAKEKGITQMEAIELGNLYNSKANISYMEASRENRAINLGDTLSIIEKDAECSESAKLIRVAEVLSNTPMTVRLKFINHVLSMYNLIHSTSFREGTEYLIGKETIYYIFNGSFERPKEYYQNLLIAHSLGWINGRDMNMSSSYILSCIKKHPNFDYKDVTQDHLRDVAANLKKFLDASATPEELEMVENKYKFSIDEHNELYKMVKLKQQENQLSSHFKE